MLAWFSMRRPRYPKEGPLNEWSNTAQKLHLWVWGSFLGLLVGFFSENRKAFESFLHCLKLSKRKDITLRTLRRWTFEKFEPSSYPGLSAFLYRWCKNQLFKFSFVSSLVVTTFFLNLLLITNWYCIINQQTLHNSLIAKFIWSMLLPSFITNNRHSLILIIISIFTFLSVIDRLLQADSSVEITHGRNKGPK